MCPCSASLQESEVTLTGEAPHLGFFCSSRQNKGAQNARLDFLFESDEEALVVGEKNKLVALFIS